MLTLHSRPGCGLCDDARTLLDRAGVRYVVVDISGNPQLEAAFGFEIPVLTDAEGRVLAKGRIGAAELTRALLRVPGRAR